MLLVAKAFIIVAVLSKELLVVKHAVEFSIVGGVVTQTRSVQEKKLLSKTNFTSILLNIVVLTVLHI